MEKTKYSLTHADTTGTKNFIMYFLDEVSRQKYIRSEFNFTYKELKNLWQSVSKVDREAAKNALYISRMDHMKWYENQYKVEEKELA